MIRFLGNLLLPWVGEVDDAHHVVIIQDAQLFDVH